VALTKRQREILDYLEGFIARHGYSPSLQEIGDHFGLSSVATVHKHVQHLVEKGLVRKSWNRSRSVEVVDGEGGAGVSLPLLGSVAAGAPIEAIEVDERISVPPEMVSSRSPHFALRVRGDSMIEEQIRDGDCVVVESRPVARDGETVVALIGGEEATLKKFYRRGARVRLVPANASMRAIEVPASEVEIRGVVRGLLRCY
jgi:repressor LexA